MPATVSDLSQALDGFFDQLDAAARAGVFASEAPLIGALGDQADDALAFIETAQTEVSALLGAVALDPEEELATALAAAFEDLDLIEATEIDGDLALRLTVNGAAALADIGVMADLGLPSLGFELDADVDLDAVYGAEFGFLFDTDDGSFALDDLAFDGGVANGLSVGLEGEFSFDAMAQLGFLEVGAVAAPDGDPDVELNFQLDFEEGGALGAPEVSVTGGVALSAELTTGAPLPFLPTFGADFSLAYDVAAGEGGGLTSELTSLGFDDVSIRLEFLEDLLGSTLERIGEITGGFPLGPIIRLFEQRLPLFQQLSTFFPGLDEDGDTDVTLKDLLALYAQNGDFALLNTLGVIVDVLGVIDTISDLASEEGLTLGSVGLNQTALDALGAGESGGALGDVFDGLGDGFGFGELFGDGALADGLQAASDAGLSIPFLEGGGPALIGQILLSDFLERPTPLLEFDLPTLALDPEVASFSFAIPIGPFAVIIGGGFGAEIDVNVGFSTRGLMDGLTGFLDGFYLAPPEGEDGQTAPVARFDAGIEALFGVSFPGLTAGVGGGFDGLLTADLADNDGLDDGLSHVTGFDLPCIFDPISGELAAGLRLRVEVGVSIFTWKFTYDIANFVIANFELGCAGPHGQSDEVLENVGLATPLGDTLRLNVGDDGESRTLPNGLGDGVTNEVFLVSRPAPPEEGEPDPGQPDDLLVRAFGVAERFAAADLIRAEAGSGDDVITIASDIAVDARLFGDGEGENDVEAGGDDVLTGAAGDDTIEGGGGDDILNGGAGDDVMRGGRGDDVLRGGAGADRIEGNAGFDQIDYSDSDAAVFLTREGGTVFGEGGDAEGDVVTNVEYLIGSRFGDLLSGDESDGNTIEGKDGDDTLVGGAGADYLIGGKGGDLIRGRAGGDDLAGYVTSRGAVNVDLESGLAYGADAEGDVLDQIEDVQGSLHGDALFGSGDGNLIAGFLGDDLIEGRAGVDTVLGGEGSDRILARGDGDEIDGGGLRSNHADRDTLSYANAASAVVAVLSAAELMGPTNNDDVILGEQTEFGGERSEFFSTIEDLEGSAGDDTLGGDYGRNRIDGRGGDDLIQGGRGDDTLVGGEGADDLFGGAGADWADYDRSVLGVDVDLQAGVGFGGDADGDAIDGVENLRGSRRDDTLEGDGGANVIDPNVGQDMVDGRGGVDTLRLDYSGVETGTGVFGGLFNGVGVDGAFDFIAGPGANISSVDFQSIERFDISGTYQTDIVFTGAGDDVIRAGGGDDAVASGTGRDIVLADDGNDLVFSQLDDTLGFTPDGGEGFFLLDGGAGIDGLSVDLSAAPSGAFLFMDDPVAERADQFASFSHGGVIRNFEFIGRVEGTAFSDALVQGGRIDNTFMAGGGDDFVAPGLGFDIVDGGETPTDPSLATDADLLLLDYSEGENGLGVSIVVNGDQGSAVRGDSQGDLIGFQNFEYADFTGTSEADLIMGIADDAYDLNGDTLRGGDGDDSIVGFNGDDSLFGGAGSDTLEGGDDDDRLQGGLAGRDDGGDRLTGGEGADRFVLGDRTGQHYGELADGAVAPDRAVITDFTSGEDVIQLAGGREDYDSFVFSGVTFIRRIDGDAPVIIARLLGAPDFDLDGDDVEYVAISGAEDGLGGLAEALAFLDLGEGAEPAFAPAATEADFALSAAIDADPTLAFTREGGQDPARLRDAAELDPAEPLRDVFSIDRPDLVAPIRIEDPVIAPPPEQNAFTVRQGGGDLAFGALIEQSINAQEIGVITLGDAVFRREGDARAFGTFENGFGLDGGFVMSTGKVIDLPGINEEDGGLVSNQFAGLTVDLEFENIGVVQNGTGQMTFYRADLSDIPFDIASLTLADDGDGIGGSPGALSGADIAGLAITGQFVDDIDALSGGSAAALDDPSVLSRFDLFDFSANGVVLTSGAQRVSASEGGAPPTDGDLAGSFNGYLDNGAATLGSFDFDGGADGFVTLGDGGRIGFDLTGSIPEDGPAYLIVAEAGGSEGFEGRFTAANKPLTPPGDLSTDFGNEGAEGDRAFTSAEFTVDLGDAGTGAGRFTHLLDLVIASEELVEFSATQLQDALSVRINGRDAIQLSDGDAATLDRLSASPAGPFHPDLVRNPAASADEGPAASRADGHSVVIPVAGFLTNGRNVVEVEVRDQRDGFLDTALLFAAVENAIAAPPPGPQNFTFATGAGQSLSGELAGAGDFALALGGEAANGAVRIDEDGDFVYRPERGFAGEDSFAYTVAGRDGSSELRLVTITVAEDRGAPLTRMLGGDGDDAMTGGRAAEAMYGFDGADTLRGAGGDDEMNGGRGRDKLKGGAGDDVMNGGKGADGLMGQAGDDALRGGAGGDRLSGGRGDDELMGGRGDDTLLGGAGDDTLNGQKGDDLLRGGEGEDVFLFNGRGVDRIADLEDGDMIGLDADALNLSGAPVAALFEAGRLFVADGGLYADRDGPGGDDARLIVEFGAATLEAEDVFLF